MALSLQDSNLVWQKVKIALASEPTGAGSFTPPPAIDAFKSLKTYLATVLGNPTLEFVPIDATDIDDASGKVLADVACTLYGVFLKKQATTTRVYTYLLDDATDDTGFATDARVLLSQGSSEESTFAIFPQGEAMAAGLVAKSYDDADGTSNALSADTPNGFVIIAAA